MKSHSRFDVERFNHMVADYHEDDPQCTLMQVSSYEDFCRKYPLSAREDLREVSETLLNNGKLAGCYVVSTSGTTSAPLMMANRIWKKSTEDCYPIQFFQYLVENVFTPDDVVANLFFPGGFGLLYEGACRFLEPIGGTVLPIGRLDSFEHDHAHFDVFRRLGLNALIGTPASIAEFAQASQEAGVELDVRKLVFSGESFYPAKRKWIRDIWPNVEFYSLYGATECGLVAVGTPKDRDEQHFIFEDWFMLEEAADGGLYVTDLKGPLIPIIRYRIGDSGSLVKLDDGSTQLRLKGRSDASFNCGGALIKHETVVEKVRGVSGLEDVSVNDVQVILTNGAKGEDILKVVVNHQAADGEDLLRKLWDKVHSIKEIAEDVGRGAVELLTAGPPDLVVTRRTKTPMVIDYRHEDASQGEAG